MAWYWSEEDVASIKAENIKLKQEVERLKKLVQEHQTYQTKQGNKES